MMQAITDYRPFGERRIGVYINIGVHECGLFSREQYEALEESQKFGSRGDWD